MIEKITFEFIKLEINNLFITTRENIIDKIQIKKFENSLIKPLCKPISEVIKSKIKTIQSIGLRFNISIINQLEIV